MCWTFVSYKKFYYSSACFQYFVGDDIFYGDLRVIWVLFDAMVHINIIPRKNNLDIECVLKTLFYK